ncbi:MAG: PKD domain-containing protein [Saprospiraceae bacterium]
MLKHCIVLYLLVFICISTTAQKHDYIWLTGYSSIPGNMEYGGSVIDFNTNPPDVYYEFRTMNLQRTNASICDTAGNLLFYTNGIFIANAIHDQMENGGELNPGQYTNDFSDNGLTLEQGALFLPYPDNDSIYILLHAARDWTGVVNPPSHVRRFYFSLINQDTQNELGSVVAKNQLIIADTLNTGKLCAVKHANGRDWWSIIQERNTNLFYRILINPNGVHLEEPQIIGDSIRSGAGQVVFSPDGTKFVQFTTVSYALGQFVYIYDFDRCTGLLENPRYLMYNDSAVAAGAAISPNSRYLYLSSFRSIYQYDLWADDIASTKDTVAVYDGFMSPFATAFYLAQLAPDGKIYINAPNGVDVMHVINNPDLPGDSCDVCQHCVQLPTYNAFSMPNFPNYRLGALEGSPCDTLRQPPTAAWSHDAQALDLAFQDASYHDIRSWHWNFGDGAMDTVPHPVHAYAAVGVYNVCLTVSNPRGADTLCREIQVLINNMAETKGGILANILPNPVTNGVALLKLEALVKLENPQVILRDALGREVLRAPLRMVDGKVQQELKIGHLAAGVYFCSVEDAGVVVWQGKVVKQ